MRPKSCVSAFIGIEMLCWLLFFFLFENMTDFSHLVIEHVHN